MFLNIITPGHHALYSLLPLSDAVATDPFLLTSQIMNVILVHGILGFREKFGIEYFRGVAEHFREKGVMVIAPVLDPTQGIEYRGGQLHDQVVAAFENGSIDPSQKTHIIAHSMGGLDSRWMLSPVNPKRIQASIRSLTTMRSAIGEPRCGVDVGAVRRGEAAGPVRENVDVDRVLTQANEFLRDHLDSLKLPFKLPLFQPFALLLTE